MKKFLFASTAALMLCASAAYADDSGTNAYVSILGGPTFDPHLNKGGTLSDMDTGYNVGGRVGVYLDNMLPWGGFSLEGDAFYTQSHYAGAGHLSSASFMGNLIYHMPLGSGLGIYGGAGLGAVDDMLAGPVHGNQTVFGWQALGGIEMPVSDMAALFAEYRYQNAHDANIGGLRGIGNTSNNLSVGVKFNL